MVKLVRQAHVEARLVGTWQIHLRLRRSVGFVDVGAGEVRLLFGGRARGVAARAEPRQQRIDRALEARVARGGIGGGPLVAPRRPLPRGGPPHATRGGGAPPPPPPDPNPHGGGGGRGGGA